MLVPQLYRIVPITARKLPLFGKRPLYHKNRLRPDLYYGLQHHVIHASSMHENGESSCEPPSVYMKDVETTDRENDCTPRPSEVQTSTLTRTMTFSTSTRMNCPPPPVVQAWPVNDDINEERIEETTAAKPAHRHRDTLPVCSPIPDRSEVERARAGASCGSASAHVARRVVPRLAGLADYAMRAFLTE